MLSTFGSDIGGHLAQHHHPLVLDIQMDVRIVLRLALVCGSNDTVTSKDHFGGFDTR